MNLPVTATDPTSNDSLIVGDVLSAITANEYDVASRNQYMNLRDSYIYGDGLWSTLEIDDGSNRTMYNFLERVVDIHTAQLMGRLFSVYSTYDKEDLSIYDDGNDPDGAKRKIGKLTNKSRQTDSDARKRIIDAVIRDNDGPRLFKHAARIGSAYGTTIIKQWWDPKEKRVRLSLIESPQNYRALWSDSDFRERDGDAYVWQISVASANRLYKSKVGEGRQFEYSVDGAPFTNMGDSNTADPINTRNNNSDIPTQTQRPMVTVVDYTGYLDGWKMTGKTPTRCKNGEETKLSLLIVGGVLVQTITDEYLMPIYYIINNREIPRRSWGASDLPDSALEINADFLERMSDYVTLMNKTVFPMYQMIGFNPASLPKKQQREIAAVSMTQDQKIEIAPQPNSLAQEYAALFQQQMDAFVKVTGIGRIMFDDPTVSADSNAALMTTMKGIIDIVEDKQARWTPVIMRMFDDTLKLVSHHVKEVTDMIETDDDWSLRVEWPSVLRREDQGFQQIWLNLFNAGVVSLETYLQKIGIEDISEEIDRLRENYDDKVIAAIVSNSRQQLAMGVISPAPENPVPEVKYNFTGVMTPEQQANLADMQGINNGRWGATKGPQGSQGRAANENAVNEGDLNGSPFDGGMPVNVGPDGVPSDGSAAGMAPQTNGQSGSINPTLTTADNQGGMPSSQPGSGATPVSPEGAIAMNNQQSGR